MLSYQHTYHAGGAADVLKHATLITLLQHLTQKPKGLTYYETHTGRGLYDLSHPHAQKTLEATHGINRLTHQDLQALGLQNMLPKQGIYAGSVMLAAQLTRPHDVLHVAEAHPQELQALRQAVKADRRIHVHAGNGHQLIPPLLPPPTARGLVLIDPSYEVKTEYLQTAHTAQAMLKRWPKAVIFIWYPILANAQHQPLLHHLEKLNPPGFHHAPVVYAPQHPGMRGSGHIILNMPHMAKATLAHRLTTLGQIL